MRIALIAGVMVVIVAAPSIAFMFKTLSHVAAILSGAI